MKRFCDLSDAGIEIIDVTKDALTYMVPYDVAEFESDLRGVEKSDQMLQVVTEIKCRLDDMIDHLDDVKNRLEAILHDDA